MKNLRKVLAVVLVVAMAFTLVTVASAKQIGDYSDISSVEYKEAVDLVTGLGVMVGSGGTTFDPQDTFTREMAAKVICYIVLGPTAAQMLSTSTSNFADVETSRWSAPFIQYCVSKGIINGDGTGNFNPTGNVTGSQLAKMLLTAVGYGKNGEYIGVNWEISAISDAASLGILSLNVNYSAPATREEVAQYVLNALNVPYVVYSKDTGSYVDKAAPYVDMATNVFNGLYRDVVTVNGVRGYTWTDASGLTYSGFYQAESVLGTSMNGAEIAELATVTSPNYIAQLAATASYFYNGKVLEQKADGDTLSAAGMYFNTTSGTIRTSADTTADAGDTLYSVPKGAIVNFINTNSDKYAEKVTIIEKDVATLAADPIVSVTTGNVTISGVAGCTNQLPAYVPGYANLSANDVVLWYKDSLGVFHIEKAQSVTSTLASYVSGATITVDGTTYTYSQLASTIASATVQGFFGVPGTTFYFDDGGYLVNAVQATTPNVASNYLFCLDTTASGFSTIAMVVLSDGTTSVVNVDPTGVAASANKFFSFTESSDGVYKLAAVTDDAKAIGAETTAGTLFNAYAAETDTPANVTYTIAKNAVKFLSETAPATTSMLLANNNTIFLYQGAAAVSAYTGITNVPSYVANADNENVYVLYVDGVAIMVYATGGTPDVTTTTLGDWVYIMNTTKTVTYVSPTLATYTYQALVNGVQKTITVASSNDASTFNGTVGLYLVTGYDANGYVTLADDTAATPPATAHHTAAVAADKLAVSSGTITTDASEYYILSSNVHYYYIDHTTLLTTGAVTFSELTAAQVNALTSTGATVDLIQTSGADTSIVAVYIYVA